MKKRVPSFLAGVLTATLALTMTTTALAASGKVTYNFSNIAWNGQTKITSGETVTAQNGQQVPSSILYTDEAGGKTNYLPIRTISELLNVEIGYDPATKTVYLGQQADTVAAAKGLWQKTVDADGITYKSEKMDIDYDALPLYQPSWQADGWGLASLTTMTQRTIWSYQGDGGRISLSCILPGDHTYNFGTGSISTGQVTLQGYQADLYFMEKSCYLVWENSDGILFSVSGPTEDAALLEQLAESVQPVSDTTTYMLSGLPDGYALLDRAASGNTVSEAWAKDGDGMALTWLYTSGQVALPDGTPETVTVRGAKAQFWAAQEPYQGNTVTVNGETMTGSTFTNNGVTVSTVDIPGVRSKQVNTLVWSNGGIQFRLQSILDKDTMLRIAESTK
jgi:hypothetical protein